jgi:hypothetical protein
MLAPCIAGGSFLVFEKMETFNKIDVLEIASPFDASALLSASCAQGENCSG